ncbi:Flp family type IVb pilin [Vibrio lentus]
MLTNLYFKVCTYLTTFKNDERGVTAIEYGLIAAAMAVVLVGAFYSSDGTGLTAQLTKVFGEITGALTSAATTLAAE